MTALALCHVSVLAALVTVISATGGGHFALAQNDPGGSCEVTAGHLTQGVIEQSDAGTVGLCNY